MDTTAPAAPLVTLDPGSDSGAAGDGLTRDTTPTLSGSAEPNSSITLQRDGVTVASLTADGGGLWSWTEPTPLADGVYSYTATATDAAGNVSAGSAALGVTLDATPPAITGVTLPADGLYKAGDTLLLRLTFSEPVQLAGGTPGLLLDLGGVARQALYLSGQGGSELVFAYTVQGGDLDADGLGVTALQLNGATLRDAAGNEAGLTLNGLGPTAGIRVDGVAPGILGVAVPADGTYGAGQVLRLTVTLDEPVDLSGSASLGLLIGGTARQAAYVSGSGGTALVFDYVVQPGDLDSDGIGVTGLTLAPGATLRDAAGNEAGLALHGVGATAGVLVDAVPPAPPSLALDPGSDSGITGDGRTRDTTPTLSGSAEPNSSVTILVDGVADGVALADGAGLWSHTLLTPLADGPHSLTATATDAQNNVSAPSAPLLLTIDTAAPGAPLLALDPGSDSGTAGDGLTRDTTPTLSGSAEPNSSITLQRDGVTVASLTADGSGLWSWTEPTPLADGVYSYTATATDAAGNVSASSAALGVTIDTTAPAAPLVTLDPGSDSGAAGDGLTRDTTPTLSGSAEPNSSVTLQRDGVTVASLTADGGGLWSWTEPTPLADGVYSYTATATDAAGNVSAGSAALGVTIDTTAPAAPSSRSTPAPTAAPPATG
ncbi:Ig-like domain-containing protein [Pseudoroseomonas cervicalis]|uniref:Ig-like domain-containing protein n=1 Tax=Teichococcus cervicalis TaxID=204525 RepID=UPI0034A02A2D